MAEAAKTEFWRDLKPIEKVFQTHSLPEMYTPNIATDDRRYYVPLSETVGTRPVWISISQNSWCDVLMATGAGLVNRHYHPHEVFAFTISGRLQMKATPSTRSTPRTISQRRSRRLIACAPPRLDRRLVRGRLQERVDAREVAAAEPVGGREPVDLLFENPVHVRGVEHETIVRWRCVVVPPD